MHRRLFLQNGTLLTFSWFLPTRIHRLAFRGRVLNLETQEEGKNPNWADPKLGATAKASSWFTESHPGGYVPSNVFGDILQIGWETGEETTGAWLEVNFPEVRPRPRTLDSGQASSL